MGIESTMDFYLRGQDGWRETEHDGHGKELAQFGTREVEPADGLSVQLTIDAMLQNYAEKEVAQLADQYHPEGISIIISDPNTGDILALANYPTFDPNHYGDAAVGNLTNRAVTDAFEPGSVFKIVTVAAALNEGLVKPEDHFDCALPTITYRNHVLKLPKDDEPLGNISVTEIVEHSSNRGAANMGILLGEKRLHDYASAFGFGQVTGVPLGAESRGDLHPLKDFESDRLMITRVPMGQAVSATAMQVHQAMSIIANGGVLMQPHLVKRVFDAKGETVASFPPKAVSRVVSAHAADQTIQMLCNVVSSNGTAVKAKLEDITVAGKTGTAQKIVDGKYAPGHDVATFSGFFPAERPRLVITVIVDDAKMKGTAYGGQVSAPAFQRVAQQAVEYLGIQPVGGKSNLVAMKGDNLDWFR
jgi:cell division protein FtsI/penicillin-binding protein 2